MRNYLLGVATPFVAVGLFYAVVFAWLWISLRMSDRGWFLERGGVLGEVYDREHERRTYPFRIPGLAFGRYWNGYREQSSWYVEIGHRRFGFTFGRSTKRRTRTR